MSPALDRRTFLLSAGALTLVGCQSSPAEPEPAPTETGSSSPAAADQGPLVIEREGGVIATEQDAQQLMDSLTTTLASGDADGLIAALALKDEQEVELWRRRAELYSSEEIFEGRFFVGSPPQDATRQTEGEVLEFPAGLVFSHQIKGCDARDVVEEMQAVYRKEGEDGQLEIVELQAPQNSFRPAPWDALDMEFLVSDHAVIAFRQEERSTAESWQASIDRGVARAMELLPVPAGQEKLLVTLLWSGAHEQVWTASEETTEVWGRAWRHFYLDPWSLASGQEVELDDDDAPAGTARTGLYADFIRGLDQVERLSAHEAAHALANQWGTRSTQWESEGFATWCEHRLGYRDLRATAGGTAAGFSDFAQRTIDGEASFFDGPDAGLDYDAAGMVFLTVDEEEGLEGVLEQARRSYQHLRREEEVQELFDRTLRRIEGA
ncbi:hypothetical protein [Nesterenkonia flava]|uniref:Uncharacterized protein n=1 Tax=Nesterenkonia flava TaxID=469799 RepID=A0ABU1FQV7_9MICC|nr:hypothetical protein [Nesterenkonia flava]MDR5711029.1 hypothetical protein [Nesterenkonia flava]